MTLLQFRPVDGRLDEILSMLMHSREVASHPSLSYAIRLVSEEIIVNILNYAYPQQAEGYLTLCLWDDDGEITFDSMSGPIPGISSFGIGQGASCSVSGGIPG